jgi:hypothetical protein
VKAEDLSTSGICDALGDDRYDSVEPLPDDRIYMEAGAGAEAR